MAAKKKLKKIADFVRNLNFHGTLYSRGFNMNKIKKYFLQTLLPAAALVLSVTLSVIPSGCRTSIEGVEFLDGDFSVPQIVGMEVAGSKTVSVDFSRSVSVSHVHLEDADGNEEPVSAVPCDENSRVDFVMDRSMEIGKKYVLDAMLEDERGNSVTVSVDFLGYNDRVPVLALSEIRIKNKSKSDKSEFVEIYALSSGNLSGLELVSASDGDAKKYSFPAIEVSAGEYIVVHMRNGDSGCVDELGKNLSLASTSDSSPSARDLFAQNESEGRFATSADIIAIRNGPSGKVLDVFVYADSAKPNAWNESVETFASLVNGSGLWVDGSGNPACSVEGAFATSSLNRESHTACRRNVQNLSPEGFVSGASQWYEVSATKEQTPGRRN